MQLYTGDKIKSYEILEYLASGGYGSVYKARDAETGQLVALKMMSPGNNQLQHKARFVREIETLNHLCHPSIVKLYKWETQEDPLWYTMELLNGPSLQRLMNEERPLYAKVTILRQVASALAHLHDQGYIHRDVKPQNIMFRTPESTVPVLFDMGLVHDPCSNLTLGRQILGTPGYLSPEQMDGRYEYKQIDVWALGVIMYQWLTKIHPFVGTGKSTIEVMHSIQSVPIINPAQIAPLVDPYLAEVCSLALEKDPEKRYPDGRSFENALAKWEHANYQQCVDKGRAEAKDGKLDDAIHMLEKAYLWQAEEEVVGELKKLWEKKLGQTDIRLLPENKIVEAQLRGQEKGESLTIRVRRLVSDTAISANQHIYVVCVKNTRRLSNAFREEVKPLEELAQKHWQGDNADVAQSADTGSTTPKSVGRSWLRRIVVGLALLAAIVAIGLGVAAKLSGAKTTQEFVTWAKSQWPIKPVVKPIDPKPPEITQPNHPVVSQPKPISGVAKVIATKSFLGHSDWVHAASFAPGAAIIASGSADQTIRLWDVATGKELKRMGDHTAAVWTIAFHPSGKLLASGSADTTVRLWSVPDGSLTKTLSGHADIVFTVRFGQQGKMIASGNGDKSIKLWDTETGKELRHIAGHTKWILSVAFAADNRSLASGSTDTMVKLWDLASGKETATFAGHTQDVYCVDFTPDGKRLISGSEDQSIKIWEVATGKALNTIAGHSQAVLALAVSPDGKILASGSADNTIKLWDLDSGRELQTLLGHTNWVLSLEFSADGTMLLSGSADKNIHLWMNQ